MCFVCKKRGPNKVVSFLDSSDKLLNDEEIQNFGREVSTPKPEGGCGVLVSYWKKICKLGIKMALYPNLLKSYFQNMQLQQLYYFQNSFIIQNVSIRFIASAI